MSEVLINSLVVEIRHADSFVYLDVCGSTTDRLRDSLGKGFIGTAPTVATGELKCDAERLTVNFNHAVFLVSQIWTTTPIRVMTVAERAWEMVSQAIGASRTVTRVGMRTVFLHHVTSREAGQQIIDNAGLKVQPTLLPLISGTPEGLTMLVPIGDGRRARVGIDHVTSKRNPFVTESLWKYTPDMGVQFDLDVTLEPVGNFGRPELRTFMKAAWAWSTRAHELLAASGEK